jgi:hypothetical protein
MGHILTVKWKHDPPNKWWEAAEFTLTNDTDAELVNPLIEFTVDTNQKLSDNSGLHVSRPEGSNHVKARLAEWLQKVKPHSSIKFSIGISPVSGGDVGPLPRNLKINGEGSSEPSGPVMPQNLRVTAATDTTLTFAWDASGDPAEIAHYDLSWSKEGAPASNARTNGTTYTITKLAADTEYRLAVWAVDVHGRSSQIATAGGRTHSGKPQPPRPPAAYPASAPFVDATFWPTPRLRKWYKAWGVKGFFLGFLTPRTVAGVQRLAWGGYEKMTDKYEPRQDSECKAGRQEPVSSLAGDSPYLRWLTRDIQAEGGIIIPSVGGASGHPIEQEPDVSVEHAVEEYLAAVDNYATHFLDFDIEGSALGSVELQRKHVQVLNELRRRRPELKISHTFAIDTDGYNHLTISLVEQMVAGGYKPDMVMGMLMEMKVVNDDYFQSLVAGAEWMVRYHCEKFGWSEQESWSRLGLCPMFGANIGAAEDSRKVTTVEHMRKLVELARAKGVATVSGWSANRDYNAHNPDQKCEDTPSCHAGPPYSNVYACTHVDQEHAEFSKIAATYTGHKHTHPGTGHRGDEPGKRQAEQQPADEVPQQVRSSSDDYTPIVTELTASAPAPAVNVTVTVNIGEPRR